MCQNKLCKKAWEGRVRVFLYSVSSSYGKDNKHPGTPPPGKNDVEGKVSSAQDSQGRRLCWVGIIITSVSSFHRFAVATPEELAVNNDDCAICWDSMQSARKLPCGHLFHKYLVGLQGLGRGVMWASVTLRATSNQLSAELWLLTAWALLVCF